MRPRLRLTQAAVTMAVAVCVMAAQAWGQETRPGTRDQPSETRGEQAPPSLEAPTASLASYPLEMLSLLAPPAMRGPVTLFPSIAVSEEYNDNLFLDNANKQSDFITGFSPTVLLLINRPALQLSAGYSFTAEVYARESQFNNALDRQYFFLGGVYRATPQVTVRLADQFAWDRRSNILAQQAFSTARQQSWSNTVTPGLSWQMSQTTSLDLSGSYQAQRFIGQGSGLDSDAYNFQSTLIHSLTPRLSVTPGYGFTFLDLRGQEDSTTHVPTLGFIYRLTPDLTANVRGGPAITQIGGETSITPAGSASLIQRLRFGYASLQYTRGVGVAGGFGGTTDTQTASGNLLLPNVARGLVLLFSAAYTTAESVTSRQSGQVDVNAYSLNLGASYQITRFVAAFGGYSFVRQRTEGRSTLQVDADQNRVRFGLQFGYPFNFD